MRWAGHVPRMGEDRGVHRVLVGKPEGKRPLGRPRRKWEDNIKMDLKLKYQHSHVKVKPALQPRHSQCVCSMSATGSSFYITYMTKYSMH
jgi:hypothetical protein